jgi:hypothetical protein
MLNSSRLSTLEISISVLRTFQKHLDDSLGHVHICRDFSNKIIHVLDGACLDATTLEFLDFFERDARLF